jgi:hypothetical protein
METSYLNEKEPFCSMKYSLSLVVKGREFCCLMIWLKEVIGPFEEMPTSGPLKTQSVGKNYAWIAKRW